MVLVQNETVFRWPCHFLVTVGLSQPTARRLLAPSFLLQPLSLQPGSSWQQPCAAQVSRALRELRQSQLAP